MSNSYLSCILYLSYFLYQQQLKKAFSLLFIQNFCWRMKLGTQVTIDSLMSLAIQAVVQQIETANTKGNKLRGLLLGSELHNLLYEWFIVRIKCFDYLATQIPNRLNKLLYFSSSVLLVSLSHSLSLSLNALMLGPLSPFMSYKLYGAYIIT